MAKVIFCLILLKLAAAQDCGYCTSCMKQDSRQILITVELIGSESILAKVGNKIIQKVSLAISNLVFFTNFCPIIIDISGNTVKLQASGFQKLAKMKHFWHF